MNYFELIIGIPLLWGAINGFRKGLILELASLAALFLGIWGAMKFSHLLGEHLGKWLEVSPQLVSMISFFLTFIIIVLGVYLIAKLIDKSLKLAAMGLLIRISGALFGLIKYTLILGVLFYLFEDFNAKWEFIDPKKYEDAYTVKGLKRVNAPVYNWLSGMDPEKLIEEEKDRLTKPN